MFVRPDSRMVVLSPTNAAGFGSNEMTRPVSPARGEATRAELPDVGADIENGIARFDEVEEEVCGRVGRQFFEPTFVTPL